MSCASLFRRLYSFQVVCLQQQPLQFFCPLFRGSEYLCPKIMITTNSEILNHPHITGQIDDAELVILENIYSSQNRSHSLTQRELAEASGLSLGMTNTLLKRFAEKGWVMLKRLNSRNIHYAISPEGIAEIARRSYRYFRRTARSAALYKLILDAFVMKLKREEIARLVLAGASDLDFMLEYVCSRHGIVFIKSIDTAKAARLAQNPDTAIIHAENRAGTARPNEYNLDTVLMGKQFA